MGTKDPWLSDPVAGGMYEIQPPATDLDPKQVTERRLPQLLVDVVCSDAVTPGTCLCLGQCLTPGTVELPTTINLGTLIEDIGVYQGGLIFETFDADAPEYAGIAPESLIKAVAVTGNDIPHGVDSFKAAIAGAAWALIEAGTGRYITMPTAPGLGKLCVTETDVKVLGLYGGILAAQEESTFALVGLATGSSGKIRLGQLTSSAQAGAVTWKALEVFDDGTTSMIGDNIAGIILGDYT